MQLNHTLFQVKPTSLAPTTGRLLVAEPFLEQDCFHRSVILMIENQSEGCMGLILNKPLEITLNQIVKGLEHVEEIPLFMGGPVQSKHLFYIHTLGELIPNSMSLGNGLYIDGDFDLILSYIRSGNQVDGRIKFFVGYSGWENEQLQQEIAENNWLVVNNSVQETFHADLENMWRRIIQSQEKKFHNWLYYPSLPTLN